MFIMGVVDLIPYWFQVPSEVHKAWPDPFHAQISHHQLQDGGSTVLDLGHLDMKDVTPSVIHLQETNLQPARAGVPWSCHSTHVVCLCLQTGLQPLKEDKQALSFTTAIVRGLYLPIC